MITGKDWKFSKYLLDKDDREWKSFWCNDDKEIWNLEYFEVVGNIYEDKDLLDLKD